MGSLTNESPTKSSKELLQTEKVMPEFIEDSKEYLSRCEEISFLKDKLTPTNIEHSNIEINADTSNQYEVSTIIKEAENLIVKYNLMNNAKGKKELSKAIYKNIEDIITILSNGNKEPKTTEEELMKISEIGKDYLEGPTQAKLLDAVLEEYQRLQKAKIKKFEEKKKSLQSTQDKEVSYKDPYVSSNDSEVSVKKQSVAQPNQTFKKESKSVKKLQHKALFNATSKQKTSAQELKPNITARSKEGNKKKLNKNVQSGRSSKKDDSWIGAYSEEFNDATLWN